MMRAPLALSLLLAPLAAAAVPLELNHQGRLFDAAGDPLHGELEVIFSIFDAASAGNAVFEETHALDIVDGYFSVVLGGATSSNPLDEQIFSSNELFLQITVDGSTLEERHRIRSVPWAIRAQTASNLSGGVVDATEIRVNGTTVIDASGGVSGTLSWSGLSEVPEGFADGVDDDTTYTAGAGLVLDGTEFSLDEAFVPEYTAGSGLVKSGTEFSLDSTVIPQYTAGTGLVKSGTEFSLDPGAIPQYTAGTGLNLAGREFSLASNALSWSNLTGIPADIADGDQNTTYSAGNGLSLSGTTFSLNPAALQWTALQGIPADIADGDQNTTYSAGNGLSLSGTTFSLNPAALQWTALQGIPADIADGDQNTTYSAGSGLSLTGTQFSLNPSALAWSAIQGIPADIADGDQNTQLSEAQVEGYIENGGLNLAGPLQAPSAAFAGSVRVGNDTGACNSSRTGTLRYRTPEGLQVCNGTVWTSALSMPVVYQGGCSADGSTGWRYFCLDRTVINTASDYLTIATGTSGSSTSNVTGRITARVAGYYRVSYTVNGSSQNYKYTQLYKNGSVISYVLEQDDIARWRHLSDSKVVWLDVNDYLNLYVYSDAGVNFDDDGGYGHPDGVTYNRRNWVTVEYLGSRY